MPNDAAVPVESSPTETFVAPSDPGQYAEWRQTGKTPEPKSAAAESTTPKEAPAPSKESSAASQDAGKGAPASEAGSHKQEPKRGNAETRLNEILADLKTAGLTPAELKTFKRAAQQDAAASSGEKDGKTASSPASEAPKGLEPPQKPDFKNWTGTWEELEAAKDDYAEKLAEYKAQKAVRDYAMQQANAAQAKELTGKVQEAQKRYGDEAAGTIQGTAKTIFAPDSGVPQVVKAIINDSPVLVDLLYVMGSKPAELQEFLESAKTNPGAALRKVVLVEKLVQEELAKGSSGKEPAAGESGSSTERDENGRFQSSAAPAKKPSKAPPPPAEMGGHGSPPPDPVDSAATAYATSGDPDAFRRFREAANRRDLAARRG